MSGTVLLTVALAVSVALAGYGAAVAPGDAPPPPAPALTPRAGCASETSAIRAERLDDGSVVVTHLGRVCFDEAGQVLRQEPGAAGEVP